MERGGGHGLGDGIPSWKGRQKRSSVNAKTEKEKAERPAASSPDTFSRAIRESIGIGDGGPLFYPWAGPSLDFSYEREAWLEMRDRDPEATYRADARRNDAALLRMKRKVLAAEYSRLLLEEYRLRSSECTLGGPFSQPKQQQHSTFQPGSLPGEQQHSTFQPGLWPWPGEQQHLQYSMPGPDFLPGEQQQSADKTFELDPHSGSWPGEQQHLQSLVSQPDLQAGQQQYPACLPSDPTSWPGEQLHSERLMPGMALQPGEQQQSADLTFGLDPSSNMPEMDDLDVETTFDLDMSTGEVMLHVQTEVIVPSGQQHSGQSSVGPSALHDEPQHSTPSSSLPASLSGEQQQAECLMPGPSSKSGECSHSASETDELPGSSPGLQQHSVHLGSSPGLQQHSVHLEPGPSSRSGEQQHVEPAAAGGSSPTERRQNSGKSWDSIFRPTGRPGKWQLDHPFGWLPVPFPEDLLPADASRRMQKQRSSSQTTADRRHPVASVDRRHPVASSDRRHPVASSDRRHPVASSDQTTGDRRHPVTSSSQPGDRRHPVTYSSQPGDRRHPVASSSQPGDRRHPVASSSQPRDPRLSPRSSKSGDQRRDPVASSSQPDDQRRQPGGHQLPPLSSQQRQDGARPTSSSVPNLEAVDWQDSACHPHVPGSQLDQLEGGHQDRA